MPPQQGDREALHDAKVAVVKFEVANNMPRREHAFGVCMNFYSKVVSDRGRAREKMEQIKPQTKGFEKYLLIKTGRLNNGFARRVISQNPLPETVGETVGNGVEKMLLMMASDSRRQQIHRTRMHCNNHQLWIATNSSSSPPAKSF